MDDMQKISGVPEDFVEPTPREALAEVVETCRHALKQRLARRYSLRDNLETLERQARRHLKKPWDSDWTGEATQIITKASELFEELVADDLKHTPAVGHA